MTFAFNTSGNSQTTGRTKYAVSLGKLRNTIASTTRTFNYANRTSPNLNTTFNYLFNMPNADPIIFNNYLTISPFYEKNIITPNAITPNYVSSGPYTPSQIKGAYSVTNVTPISGKRAAIITIIVAYYNPYLVGDVVKFGKLFNLPPCNLKLYRFTNQFNSNWATEGTLDVQWSYSINPYAEIRVIFAASASSTDLFNAIKFANNKNNFSPPVNTDVLSMSWGTPDTGIFSQSIYNYFTCPNTIYIASSGDYNYVSFPSSSINVVAVGGTSLKLNSDNSRNLETVWSKDGCGYSKSFSKPSWQPNIANNGLRMTADLACVADPLTPAIVVLNGKLYTIGGTSLSAPIFAGMMSLLQQNKINLGIQTYTSVQNLSNTIQPKLYKNPTCFYDVTSGSSSGYRATTGYDIPCGLGVPICNKLASSV